MTATKNNSIFKKLGALAMAMCLTCALAVSASAATVVDEDTTTYSVTIYKDNGSDISMANDAVAGDAVATTLEDGTVQIEIPIQPLYNYTAMGIFTADGYLQSVDVEGAISASVTPNTTPYNSAVLTIVVENMPEDGRFVVSDSTINLYDVGTSDTYWLSHVTPSFIIELK